MYVIWRKSCLVPSIETGLRVELGVRGEVSMLVRLPLVGGLEVESQLRARTEESEKMHDIHKPITLDDLTDPENN